MQKIKRQMLSTNEAIFGKELQLGTNRIQVVGKGTLLIHFKRNMVLYA